MKGILQLVLHAHLPFIKHPDYKNFYEESWFFEAIVEVYLPILRTFYRLEKEHIDFKITVSFSPPLIEMLEDKTLLARFDDYLDDLLSISKDEIINSKNQNEKELAEYYFNNLKELKNLFSDKISRNILKGFKEFQEKGNIQMIICNGTHNYMPAFENKDIFIKNSLSIANKVFLDTFNKNPRGLWLAEMGYFEGLDRYLKNNNFEFTFLNFNSIDSENFYAPLLSDEGLIFYVRDPKTNSKIWDANIGYPGNENYREFYSDISFEKESRSLKKFNEKYGTKTNTGIKYKSITNKNLGNENKNYYNPKKAKFQIKNDVLDFLKEKKEQIMLLCENNYEFTPVLTAPFDMELFGHWWYEGPEFLYELFKQIDKVDFLKSGYHDSIVNDIKLIKATPKFSSWGDQGYSQTWVDEKNIWVYPFIETVYKKILEYKEVNFNNLENRIYSQMLREFFLLVSSDWYFLIYNRSSKDYSEMRIKNHIANFFALDKMLVNSSKLKNVSFLQDLENINSIFSFINKDFIFSYQNSF
jgi:1,4-alpha-glucan branching enzyme